MIKNILLTVAYSPFMVATSQSLTNNFTFSGEWTVVCIHPYSLESMYTEKLLLRKDKSLLVERSDIYGNFSYSGKYEIEQKDDRYLINHTNIVSSKRIMPNNIMKLVSVGTSNMLVSDADPFTCIYNRM